jgi:DNA-binding beta-propeller fold protein YncE
MRCRLIAALAAVVTAASVQAAPLEQVASITMPNVKGRIDHFAVDAAGHRLFVAALGNDTVEVLDTGAARHLRSLTGFGEPQGLAYVADPPRLFVANGSADRLDILDGATFAPIQRVGKLPDADNVRYDAAARQVVVGYGKGALRFMALDRPGSGREIQLAAHPESFQLEKNGERVFVNIPDARQVAVVDRAKDQVVATWEVPGARANFPMALDEGGRRLFVGARSPAALLVYDSDSGKVVSRIDIGGDTDDVFFDAVRKRIYVVCGAGRIDVLRQETRDKYVHEESIRTAPRARTGLFVPAEGRLYVAAPAQGGSEARVLVYEVR